MQLTCSAKVANRVLRAVLDNERILTCASGMDWSPAHIRAPITLGGCMIQARTRLTENKLEKHSRRILQKMKLIWNEAETTAKIDRLKLWNVAWYIHMDVSWFDVQAISAFLPGTPAVLPKQGIVFDCVLPLCLSVYVCVCVHVQKLKNYWSKLDGTS